MILVSIVAAKQVTRYPVLMKGVARDALDRDQFPGKHYTRESCN